MSEEIGTLTILDETGDRRFTWRRRKKESKAIVKEPDDLQFARKLFDEKAKQGYDSYELDEPGDISEGRKITKFNPDAKFIVQVPHITRGRSD